MQPAALKATGLVTMEFTTFSMDSSRAHIFTVASSKHVTRLVHAATSHRLHLRSWQHYSGDLEKEILIMANIRMSVNQ